MPCLKKMSLSVKLIAVRAVTLILILTLFSCGPKSDETQRTEKKRQLLIYCGITMLRPMAEIAKIIEIQENCKIIITKGGSGNLLKSIIHNKTGDLYLPGSDSYYKTINEKHKGLVIETKLVGHNKAAIMVQNNNPNNITNDLTLLTDKHFGVVIGNPDSGSIGKETKKILTKKGIFEAVVKNAMHLTTDSKDLVRVLKNKKADIVINWYAASTWDNNSDFMDTIQIDPEYSKKKKLILGLLKYSNHPDIAKKFMELAISEKGKDIFKKHGLFF